MKHKILLFVTLLFCSFGAFASLDFLGKSSIVQGEPLPVSQAFPLELEYKNNEFEILFDIVKGHYLYKDKIKVRINGEDQVVDLPNGDVVFDEYFGETEVLQYGFLVDYKNPNTKDEILDLEISYQGCAKEINLCYPVKIHTQSFKNEGFVAVSEDTQIVESDVVKEEPFKSDKLSITELASTNNVIEITDFLKSSSVVTASFVFLLVGIFVAFTPCVYPMMPLIIASTNNSKQPKIAALAYILGTVLSYALIGLIVGLLNINIQFIVQNKWFVYSIAGLLFLASLYLLGAFNLVFSNNINTWVNEKIMKINPDKNRNQVLIGFLSSLILSPCSIAPLLGVLVFINQMGAPFYGAYLLAILAIGIGIPLFLLTTSFNKFMPKSGSWMNEVKNILALVLYLLAVYIGGRGLEETIYVGLMTLGVFIYGLYLLGLNKKQITGAIISIISILYFLFNGNIVGQKEHIDSNLVKDNSRLEVVLVENKKELNNLIKESKKPVFVDFYADWCITCVRLENTVLKDENIIKLLNKDFLVVKIDLTEISEEEQDLMDSRNILGVPYYLFVDANKKEAVYTGDLSKTVFKEVLRKTMGQNDDR